MVYSVRGREIEIMHDERVYPPAEDTFLLLEGLEVRGGRALEVGTGSGLVGIHCALEGAQVVCTDVNPHALRCTRLSARRNGVELETLRTDMFDGVKGEFDLVIFNAPHLPTAPGDLTRDPWLDAAVCGGPDGHMAARRFLSGLPEHLESSGRAYLVVCDRGSGPLPSHPGLSLKEVAFRKLAFERLVLEEVRPGGA
ncbi:MAG: HemK2/MTQ2 family protein methyltransferase [Thermoplasmatota archaeon]